MSGQAPAQDGLDEATRPLPGYKARALRHAVAVLREFYDPPAIFLFGSAAKGTGSETSDMDLLVRMPSEVPRAQRGGAFRDVFAGSYPRFDLVVFTDDEVRHHLANPRSFLSSVMVAARPLYLKAPQSEPLLQRRRGADPAGG